MNSKREESAMGTWELLYYRLAHGYNKFRDKFCRCYGCAPERALVRQRKLERMERKKAKVALMKQRQREIQQRQRREFEKQYEEALLTGINMAEYKQRHGLSRDECNIGNIKNRVTLTSYFILQFKKIKIE